MFSFDEFDCNEEFGLEDYREWFWEFYGDCMDEGYSDWYRDSYGTEPVDFGIFD